LPGALKLWTGVLACKRYPEAIRSLIEDEEHLLTFYTFPQVMHRHIRSTNAIESFFSNVILPRFDGVGKGGIYYSIKGEHDD
jgi:transposase-like protein